MVVGLAKQRRVVIRYARDPGTKAPFGMVVVYRSNKGLLKVGYSKCHRRDRWDRGQGLIEAFKKAVPLGEVGRLVASAHEDMAPVIGDAVQKARRYFEKGGTAARGR